MIKMDFHMRYLVVEIARIESLPHLAVHENNRARSDPDRDVYHRSNLLLVTIPIISLKPFLEK